MQVIDLIGKVLCIFMAVVLVVAFVVMVLLCVWLLRDMWHKE